VSWFLAAAYVAAAGMLISGVRLRADPVVAERLRDLLSPKVPGSGPPLDRVRRALLVLVGVVTGFVSIPVLGAPLAVTVAIALAVAGYRLPDLLSARRAGVLRAEASARMPELLDLIAVSVGAGVSPRLALERSPDTIGGSLAVEMAWARRRVSLGDSWSAALQGVAERTGVTEIRRLAMTLQRSERLGAPVSRQLQTLARDVRAGRMARQQERARRAPVTMLFPLVFLILPSFVVSAVVPAVLVAIGEVP
jgi:tight adherence protein C